MNQACALWLALLLLAMPLSHAHQDSSTPGSPKPYCEDLEAEAAVHDYGPGPGATPVFANDGSSLIFGAGCRYGDLLDRWDAHYEHAFGGAFLLSCESACGDSATGSGSRVCYGTYADHETFPTVYVADMFVGAEGDVRFRVLADTLDQVPDPTGTEPACGDFEADLAIACVNHCAVPFGPGLDGAYQVAVEGTMGHVCTIPACMAPMPPPGVGGAIVLRDDGSGPTFQATHDDNGWTCSEVIGGEYEVTCVPPPDTSFACAAISVSAATGEGGAVRGVVACEAEEFPSSASTASLGGESSGSAMAPGAVEPQAVTCRAASGTVYTSAVPPYTVSCAYS